MYLIDCLLTLLIVILGSLVALHLHDEHLKIDGECMKIQNNEDDEENDS